MNTDPVDPTDLDIDWGDLDLTPTEEERLITECMLKMSRAAFYYALEHEEELTKALEEAFKDSTPQ